MRLLIIIILKLALSGCATQVEKYDNLLANKDYESAFNILNAEVKTGNPEAEYRMGLAWYFGHGSTPVNHQEASHWYLRAAQQGHIKSMVALAFIQLNEENSEKYRPAAISWLTLAARWNDPDARLKLQSMNEPIPPPDLFKLVNNAQVESDKKVNDALIDSAVKLTCLALTGSQCF